MADMRPYLQPFYSSPAWKACRAAYAGKITAGAEVHHKVRLTPGNVHDPHVALAWSNLELLCAECHRAEHRKAARRWRCDERGHVISPLCESE